MLKRSLSNIAMQINWALSLDNYTLPVASTIVLEN